MAIGFKEGDYYDFEGAQAVAGGIVAGGAGAVLGEGASNKALSGAGQEFNAAASLTSEGALRKMTGAAATEGEIVRFRQMLSVTRGMDRKVALRNYNTSVEFRKKMEQIATMSIDEETAQALSLHYLRTEEGRLNKKPDITVPVSKSAEYEALTERQAELDAKYGIKPGG